MRIAVYHSTDRLGTSFDRMCTVNAPQTDVYEALEYAYRYTNNINGSWSRNDIANNADWNELVTDIAPLENGMGHRSTSTFDRMLVEVDEKDFSDAAIDVFSSLSSFTIFRKKSLIFYILPGENNPVSGTK